METHQQHGWLEGQRGHRARGSAEVLVPVAGGKDGHPTSEVPNDMPERLLVGLNRIYPSPSTWLLTDMSYPAYLSGATVKLANLRTPARNSSSPLDLRQDKGFSWPAGRNRSRYHGAGAVDIRCKGLPRPSLTIGPNRPRVCLGGTELRRGAARPGRASSHRRGRRRRRPWPYWTLENIIPLGVRALRPEYWFPTLMLGLMGASALLHSLNTWLPELMRRNGFGQTASACFPMFNNIATHRSRSSHCVTHGVNFCGSLLLIVRSRDWARAVPDAELRVRANSYRTNVRGAGVSWCAGFGLGRHRWAAGRSADRGRPQLPRDLVGLPGVAPFGRFDPARAGSRPSRDTI